MYLPCWYSYTSLESWVGILGASGLGVLWLLNKESNCEEVVFCCGLTQQAAKHHTVICLPPLSLNGVEERIEKNKTNQPKN